MRSWSARCWAYRQPRHMNCFTKKIFPACGSAAGSSYQKKSSENGQTSNQLAERRLHLSYHPYPKRNAIKNYFPLPNEIFCLGLCSGEIAVYAYLMFCEDRKSFQCHPSYKTIGRALKMSRNTVSKYVKSLEVKRLIITEPTSVITKKGQKRNGSLLYTVRPIYG